ncbi:MarR family transcriptional regulator [Phycicoccus endophyticus]|uniref:MarR family transcriptional regulator n=1 Tax=Phycicoccus endophyticus TaxID=1690220 RepID=A0A7G9QZP3_9MICO|nr:helix-turn-helix domain-containing protein [Phycicoccus endophyticus]NHI20010.1 MarR family transcriptional regulator [Phycicoccus endophyticus]QNN48818.1 MarR family transcriptional regulator [Phycicoccus endophyticus]GGL42628.1 hypothetical protein GCM10012283_26540 [Phycicoccus endophyticus]
MTTHVVAGMRVLRAVADRPDPTLPLAVGDLARGLGTALSTTSRLCSELTDLGLLEHAPAYGSYRIGPQAVRLSGRAAARFVPAVRYALTLLAHRTGETAFLGAPVAGGVRVVAAVESVWTLQSPARVGELVTDARRAVVRAAWDRDEEDPGAGSGQAVESTVGMGVEVAVPVRSPAGECVAVLGVRVPVSRSTPGVARARRLLKEARQVLAAELASSPDGPDRPGSPPGDPSRAPAGLEAAWRVLWHLAGGRDTVTGIARASGLRPDRTRRLLESCRRADLVRTGRDRGDVWLGWGVHGWHRAVAVPTMLQLGRPLVARTADRAGACAFITVLDGLRSLTLVEELRDMGEGLGMTPWLGRLAPIIGSDGGPTLVQDIDERRLVDILPARHTPAQVDMFMRRFRRAARDGVLSMRSIDELGVISVSAPVRDAAGAVAAAACVVGPTEVVSPRVRAVEAETRALAAGVSELLCAPDPGAQTSR